MTDLRQAAQQALEALEGSRRSHHYCEDTWYSCPKHEDGCANEAEGDECNCGADKANEKIDQAITTLRAALAEPEQEPVGINGLTQTETDASASVMGLVGKPEPVAWDEIEREWWTEDWESFVSLEQAICVVRWAEARHGITGEGA